MSDEFYRQALAAAKTELDELLRHKSEVDRRVAQLKQTIVSLSALSGEDEQDADDSVFIPGAAQLAAARAAASIAAFAGRTMGFTDAVREVLKASRDYMTPTEVRDGLLRMGINLEAKYSNPLAVIHTTLKRLYDAGEVVIKGGGGAAASYRWKAYEALPLVPVKRGMSGDPEPAEGPGYIPAPRPKLSMPTKKEEGATSSSAEIRVPPPRVVSVEVPKKKEGK